MSLNVIIIINKGGQVTKPIIVVKIYYKLLYVIQVVGHHGDVSNHVSKCLSISPDILSQEIWTIGQTFRDMIII